MRFKTKEEFLEHGLTEYAGLTEEHRVRVRHNLGYALDTVAEIRESLNLSEAGLDNLLNHGNLISADKHVNLRDAFDTTISQLQAMPQQKREMHV